jgi:hypothetical protein
MVAGGQVTPRRRDQVIAGLGAACREQPQFPSDTESAGLILGKISAALDH